MPNQQSISIASTFLRVHYNPKSKYFSIANQSNAKVFLDKGSFTFPVDSASAIDINHKIWGPGKAIELLSDSAQYQIAVYDSTPFAFIDTSITNNADKDITYDRLTAYDFDLSPDKPAQTLKALGTAGLTNLDKASNPGSYAYLAIADPNTRTGTVCAWLTNEKSCGVIFSDIKNNTPKITPRMDFGHLLIKPGQTRSLDTFIVGHFEDVRIGLEQYAQAIADLYQIKLPPQPTVYCSWYHAKASNEKDLAANTKFASEHLKPFGFSVMQIDDLWQSGVKDNGPKKDFTKHDPKGPYPSGMKAAADNIKAQGLTPGLWYMPFAGTHDDPFYADKQHLFAQKDSKPFEVEWGGTCLDMTNPETQTYVADIARRITKDWGYEYIKIDGLWTGTAARLEYVNEGYREDDLGESNLHDKTKTHIQAYRQGLKIVRKESGPETFILGCSNAQNMRSFAPAFGLVDAMRIGDDNDRPWHKMIVGPKTANRMYFLHGKVWYNDPDPIYVRQDDVPIEQARTICSWVTLTGSLNSSSCDYTKLSPERLDLLKRTMPAHNLLVRPVDLFESETSNIWLLENGSTSVIGLFNFSDKQDLQIDYSMQKIGLDPAAQYIGFEYWSNEFIAPFAGNLKASLPKAQCKIIALRPVTDHPQIISTSRHITQGIMDISNEKWDPGSATLSAQSKVVAADPCEIRIVATKETSNWHLGSVAVSDQDKNAGVTIKIIEQNGPNIRLQIESPSESRDIKWHAAFL